MQTSALILAAGSGTRIGTPKLKLKIGGKSFLSIIADNIFSAGINEIVCVVSKDSLEWAKEREPNLNYAINSNPEDGMLSSVFYGTKELKKCDNVLIIPVDHPYVGKDTYKILTEESKKNNNIIIKPRFVDKAGHPVIVPFNLLKTIDEKCFSVGLNEIIKMSKYKQVYINVNDGGVLKNVNTLNDFENIKM
jgi:molybdenum cofactor cytidylyltransferase